MQLKDETLKWLKHTDKDYLAFYYFYHNNKSKLFNNTFISHQTVL